MASFSTYQSKLRDGLPTKDDAKWVEELLGKFQNRQTALFMRWLQIKLPTKKENRERLVIITPLRIILIKTKTFGRSVHRKYRIIDINSVIVNENSDNSSVTECIIKHCDFPPELSISRSREKLKNKEYTDSNIKVYLPKDIDREFLDILQWSLFIVTRGLPNKFKPKINIPATFKNDISDPVGPGQFVIDRYVAYCDAQSKNSGAGIAASEALIEYTLGSVVNGIYDINLAFNRTNKRIDSLQFVCLSQGLSFCKVYHKLILNQLSSLDDTNMAILMTLFETNYAIKILEFRRCDLQSKTMKSLSSSLSCTNGLSTLQEINIIDINVNKSVVLALSNGLSYIKLKVLRFTNCYLSKTATIQLFNILQKTEQYKYLTHLNLSKNQCGRQGTKAIANFLNKTHALQVLVLADASLDGNELFGALTVDGGGNLNNELSHLDTLTLLDFSGNTIGEKGAQYLSKFIQESRCLNYLKLSRCGITTTQLQKIFSAAMKNMEGFPKRMYNAKLNSQSINKRPTHCDIMLCTNLLCLSLDLSENAFGSKGADIICKLLQQRENYTIVSLNLAKNNFNVSDMKKLITNFKSLACLERLCISENVKRGIGKKTDKDGIIGKSLLYLFAQTPTLNELAITGSESSYLDIGLQHFLKGVHRISNLEFLDITGNKIGDKQFCNFIKSLEKNSTLRLVRCNDNKLTTDTYVTYLELLSNHPTIIDKIPSDDSGGKKRSNKKYSSLRDAAKQNLRGNKQQFEIDRQMMTALPREMRLEKELRRPCGTQYGICIERIRGTVQYPDYKERIPQVLVKLKNLLVTRDGLSTVGIFRIQPDANEFPTVRQALNTNNFEFRINDINCIANAIKVWFRELPIKILNPIAKDKVVRCSSQNEVSEIIAGLMEPYKSIFDWLLDLAVQVVANAHKNKMDAKNMAVVLCPNLYENNESTADALSLQQSLLRFTELAIRSRIQFRKNNPAQEVNDMLAIKAGLTPGIADQNVLSEMEQRVPIIANDDSGDDEEFKGDGNKALSAEEGDGFAGAIYSQSRFRGNSQVQNESGNGNNKIGKLNVNQYLGDHKEEMREDIAPPPAYSDYEDNDEEFNDIEANATHQSKNMSVQIEKGRVSNIAAKLVIDPTAMRPGNRGPPRPKKKESDSSAQPREIDSSANLSRPKAQKKKKKKKKGKKKKLLLESMVDNYDEASAAQATVPDMEEPKAEERRASRHVPMESKVLGGFVQPGLAMLAREASDDTEDNAEKHQRKATDDSDELNPALAHLDGEDNGQNNNETDYVFEEQSFTFETKPMGFQIEAENGKISVRSVRNISVAGNFGIKAKWDIVAVNGFRDWSSMLGMLESSLGPFTIIFAVPVKATAPPPELEKSLSNSSANHPLPPPSMNENNSALPAPVNEEKEVAAVDIVALPTQPSMVSVSAPVEDEMSDREYNASKRNFDLMSRNSSAIAKEVLNEYDDNENNIEIKCEQSVFAASNNAQKSEYRKLESAVAKMQNKNAQLLETLQVIRLKGEMERIELDNAKMVQKENVKLKKQMNDKVKPLKAQLKNANKQIQTQRQLMYQYANLLRRHKIPIPEMKASLQENDDSSSDSDSDSD